MNAYYFTASDGYPSEYTIYVTTKENDSQFRAAFPGIAKCTRRFALARGCNIEERKRETERAIAEREQRGTHP